LSGTMFILAACVA